MVVKFDFLNGQWVMPCLCFVNTSVTRGRMFCVTLCGESLHILKGNDYPAFIAVDYMIWVVKPYQRQNTDQLFVLLLTDSQGLYRF